MAAFLDSFFNPRGAVTVYLLREKSFFLLYIYICTYFLVFFRFVPEVFLLVPNFGIGLKVEV